MPDAMREIALAEIDLPDFGEPTIEPSIPRETFRARVAAALMRAAEDGLDALLVYGDREHMANIAYLTGYDPRFEEALLVVVAGRRPTLFVGNEGWSYTELAAGEFDRVLYQTMSLLAQPRGENRPLDALLREAGLAAGMRIGTIGWKSFGEGDPGATPHWLEIPSFVADALRALAGEAGAVVNATAMMMNPADGLRAINDVDQLAAFEFSATYSSQALRHVLFGVRPGMTEIEAVRLMQLTGRPNAAHIMLSGGDRATYGLPSPGLRVLERGDRFTMACTYWGSLSSRAGFLAADDAELPDASRGYVAKLVEPYFRCAVAWYEAVGIGVSGGEMFDLVQRHLGDRFFGVTLNPGHLIHLDEWLHSPIFAGSRLTLRSGMAMQIDIIPATGSPWYTSNIEDGIALADTRLREAFRARYPEAWARIERRRAFMRDVLGIRLKPEVLPFSNIAGYLPPFVLSPRRAMVAR